jgi:FAD/FMN-containing dehydrogenase
VLDRDVMRRELGTIVGADHVRDPQPPDDVDWTGRYFGAAAFLVHPSATTEVAGLVAWARERSVPLVSRGGNTGLVGGSIARDGAVVVATRRLRSLGVVDRLSRQVTVGAGATLQEVHEHVTPHGLRYPVDFGARGSATIGGSIATNAGGVNVVRYGMTRRQVVGIEAVLGTGAVVSHLGGLVKDNTGFDLAGLLCGSEGTLGIVTAARLQLVPLMPHVVTALVSCDSVARAVEIAASVCTCSDSVDAAELVTRDGVELVGRVSGDDLGVPDRAAHVLIECSGASDQSEALATLLSEFDDVDVSVAVTATHRARLWRLREEQTPSINSLGVPFKFDVTVPVASLAEFMGEIPRVIAAARPGAQTFVFGHVADGNMHVNVVGGNGDEDHLTDAVLGAVVARGGSISAEHGIGFAKRDWLHLVRSPAEIDAMRAIKGALDPDGVLNPGVLLP